MGIKYGCYMNSFAHLFLSYDQFLQKNLDSGKKHCQIQQQYKQLQHSKQTQLIKNIVKCPQRQVVNVLMFFWC